MKENPEIRRPLVPLIVANGCPGSCQEIEEGPEAGRRVQPIPRVPTRRHRHRVCCKGGSARCAFADRLPECPGLRLDLLSQANSPAVAFAATHAAHDEVANASQDLAVIEIDVTAIGKADETFGAFIRL
jgi:hypothetical protein